MAYINFQNCTKQQYDNTIYGQNDVNSCKLYFNNVELQDADNYLEKITFKKRVLPENGKKVFGLDNFIAEEVEIIIHDINTSIIQDKVRIELGTLVNNTYEYVPMGVYNIQDTPTRNDDKITIKLRDNAVLFDFNYNAKPLIDSLGGSATKMQILQDICSQANVTCGVSSFLGDSDLIGTYDNTIKGRMYVAYLAEQAGCIAKIDRNGALIFIPLDNLYTQRIPLSVVSKYVKGTTYTIERLVYELGTIKFETSSDETLQTLYISSLNPYISTQEQVEDIFDIVGGFEVDTVEILSDIIGNPSIDGYDMIQVYDDESENDVVVFTTLANNTLTYNGKFKSKYKTEIGLEERKENTTNVGDAVFKATITSEVNRLDGSVSTTISRVDTIDTRSADTSRDLQGLSENVGGQIAGLQTNYTNLQQTVESNWSLTATASQFTTLQQTVATNQQGATQKFNTIEQYIRFENGDITLGESDSPYKLKIENDRIQIYYNNIPLSNWIQNIFTAKQFNMGKLDNNGDLETGFGFIPNEENGSLDFIKIK